jgi:hypothetical protein
VIPATLAGAAALVCVAGLAFRAAGTPAPGPWFVRRRVGLGVAPASWQGGVALIAYVAAILPAGPLADRAFGRGWAVVATLGAALILIVPLAIVIVRTSADADRD